MNAIIPCRACAAARNPDCEFCLGTGKFVPFKSRRAVQAPAPTPEGSDAELIKWAAEQTWSSFAVSIAANFRQRGLSPRQREALVGMKAKSDAKVSEKAKAAVNPALGGFEGTARILDRIAESGAKWPAVRLATVDPEMSVKLTRIMSGRNAGAVNMKVEDVWFGRIDAGVWEPTAAAQALPVESKKALWTLLKDLKADPEAVFAAFGKRTGTCSCCGRALSDPESVALGIGPICREKAFG